MGRKMSGFSGTLYFGEDFVRVSRPNDRSWSLAMPFDIACFTVAMRAARSAQRTTLNWVPCSTHLAVRNGRRCRLVHFVSHGSPLSHWLWNSHFSPAFHCFSNQHAVRLRSEVGQVYIFFLVLRIVAGGCAAEEWPQESGSIAKLAEKLSVWPRSFAFFAPFCGYLLC
jgi:hypothetical protein